MKIMAVNSNTEITKNSICKQTDVQNVNTALKDKGTLK